MTLSDDQTARLQVLKDLSEMTTTPTGVGSKARAPISELLILADWVISGEPAHFTLASPFGQWLEGAEPTRPDTTATTGYTEQIIIHSVEEDGLPDFRMLKGRVAFIYEGCVLSGFPSESREGVGQLWKAVDTIGHGQEFQGVEYWIEFPLSIWEITR